MGKRILILTPYLKNIGGTELEAVLSAIHFYDSRLYEQVTIFSPSKHDSFFEEIINKRNIGFLNYPAFFNSKIVLFINKLFKKLGLNIPLFEFVYWFFISLRYTHFFILTYPGSTYFFSLFRFYDKSKKYVAKVTMWHYNLLSDSHQFIYKKFNAIIVFNEAQKVFWEQNNFLQNIRALDIMILNEANLIGLPEKTFSKDALCFGYLGRISREKNIEDMILLIHFLNQNKQKCQLIIQGSGDLEYLNELQHLVLKHKLNDFIIFKIGFISPNKTHDFYSQIDILLVTSTNEGGPMTSLEAAAAGCYVMGYEIGAMEDRFGQFPYVVNSNFNSLCNSALAFLNLTTFEKYRIVSEFRKFYISKLCNASKGQQLNNFFK